MQDFSLTFKNSDEAIEMILVNKITITNIFRSDAHIWRVVGYYEKTEGKTVNQIQMVEVGENLLLALQRFYNSYAAEITASGQVVKKSPTPGKVMSLRDRSSDDLIG